MHLPSILLGVTLIGAHRRDSAGAVAMSITVRINRIVVDSFELLMSPDTVAAFSIDHSTYRAEISAERRGDRYLITYSVTGTAGVAALAGIFLAVPGGRNEASWRSTDQSRVYKLILILQDVRSGTSWSTGDIVKSLAPDCTDHETPSVCRDAVLRGILPDDRNMQVWR